MSISVLVAIAGVMVAAVGTGLLGGRCIRSPSPSFIAWTTGMFALTVALLAQSFGFATGFGAVTFRVIQITAQLVTPVVLAWGLVELVARGTAARFGARLAAAALIVVIGVILATDPLAAKPFGRAWPSAAIHYQIIPHYALIGLHLAVAVAAVAAVALCAARGRGPGAQGELVPGAAAVAVGAACVVALRFTLPAESAYPALSALSAGLVWFGMTRLDGKVPGITHATSGTRDLPDRPHASHAGGGRGAGAAGRYGPAAAERDFPARGRGRPGFPPDDPSGPGGPGVPDQAGFPAPTPRDGFSAVGFPGADLPGAGRRGADAGPLYTPGAPGAEPATGAFERPGAALGAAPVPGEPRPGGPGTDIVRPAPRPHGLIAIYTLLEDKVSDFDRVADEAAEQVRAQEPDTLVYVIHTVPKAPMQRIFYEIYRDRAAYERHEQQPYIKRFVTARRPFVLATNVIELRLKYAKISPLVQAETQIPLPVGALPPAGPPAPASRAPAPGGRAPAGSRALGYGRRGSGNGPPDHGSQGWDDRRPGDTSRGWGDRRFESGPRGWGDGPPPDATRAGNDARAAGGRRGREQLPPPVPPRPYGGI
jgi:quinol monooxygenase YgiN